MSERIELGIQCPFFRELTATGVVCAIDKRSGLRITTKKKSREERSRYIRENCFMCFPENCRAYMLLQQQYAMEERSTGDGCVMAAPGGKCLGYDIACTGRQCKFYKANEKRE